MTALSWQDVTAAGLAALALGWLLGRRLRPGRRPAACENCPAARAIPGVRKPPSAEPLIGIGEPADTSRVR